MKKLVKISLFALPVLLLLFSAVWLPPKGSSERSEAVASAPPYPGRASVPLEVYTAKTREIDTTDITAADSAAPVLAEEVSAEPETDEDAPDIKPFSLVWLTDTQVYSALYPDTFRAMAGWIRENVSEFNIKFAVHTGDVVDDYKKANQWEAASEALSVLDGVVPWSALAGNHDVGPTAIDYGSFSANFGEKRFKGADGFGEIYGSGEGRYDLIEASGAKLLIISIGWNDNPGIIAWADKVVRAHSDRTVIIAAHDYLELDGSLSEYGVRLFDGIVRPNPNVRLVLCGHNHGTAMNECALDDDGDGETDRIVYGLLADYQDAKNYNSGYMRLLTFDIDKKTLRVSTCTPLDNVDAAEASFEVNFDLTRPELY